MRSINIVSLTSLIIIIFALSFVQANNFGELEITQA
jgi:hypothetical protein